MLFSTTTITLPKFRRIFSNSHELQHRVLQQVQGPKAKENLSILNSTYYQENKQRLSLSRKMAYQHFKNERSRKKCDLKNKKFYDHCHYKQNRERRLSSFKAYYKQTKMDILQMIKASPVLFKDELETALGIQQPQDWSKVTLKQVKSIPSGKVFRFITIFEFVSMVYPNVPLPIKTKTSWSWDSPYAINRFINSVEKTFHIQSPHDWYWVCREQVSGGWLGLV
eukprot:TRINITY_DN13464_c1_g1_i6.p1 TRINITY_DN13464_c1_g1~~TRINITY_DN13464_c1_g1_i6.p1  ORF type:complete len:224 (+),score=26.84 TRINITY_DN13464_c1_g1_i6:109-780(+)